MNRSFNCCKHKSKQDSESWVLVYLEIPNEKFPHTNYLLKKRLVTMLMEKLYVLNAEIVLQLFH